MWRQMFVMNSTRLNKEINSQQNIATNAFFPSYGPADLVTISTHTAYRLAPAAGRCWSYALFECSSKLYNNCYSTY